MEKKSCSLQLRMCKLAKDKQIKKKRNSRLEKPQTNPHLINAPSKITTSKISTPNNISVIHIIFLRVCRKFVLN